MPPGIAPEGRLLQFVEEVVHNRIELVIRQKAKLLVRENEDAAKVGEMQIRPGNGTNSHLLIIHIFGEGLFQKMQGQQRCAHHNAPNQQRSGGNAQRWFKQHK